jgi:hypothetical protein
MATNHFGPFLLTHLLIGESDTWLGCPMWNCVWNSRCTAVTDSFFTKCRTHYLLHCGVAIFKTSAILQRCTTTTTITQVIWNKNLRVFLSTAVGVKFQVCRICFLYHFESVNSFVLILYNSLICQRTSI